MNKFLPLIAVVTLLSTSVTQAEVVDTSEKLIAAVKSAGEGDTIELAAGKYEIAAPLELNSGVTLKGAGIDKTTITHVGSWKPSVKTLPDPEMKTKGMDTYAFLIRLNDKATDVTISDMTLLGTNMHGAIFAFRPDKLHVHDVRVKDTLWTGIRTFAMSNSKIIDCEFIDAGGRWKRGGEPGIKGGITGGAIFCIWTTDTEFAHNRFVRTQMGKGDEFYGIKGRQGKRCRIHHNTIGANFSIEFPFEGDEDMEIDHNVCYGAISIPKYAGGKVPESGRTFHIHHNWFHAGYSIEFVRNGVEIDHNLFDFDVKKDGGNLISGFGQAPAKGPAKFHNNLVNNPGRGVIWINEPYDNFEIYNNHIVARTTITPRKEGLFGINGNSDFSTYALRNNIIECQGLSRPLFRNENSYKMTIENNTLINIANADKVKNPKTNATVGLEKPLKFTCGVHDEFTVDGWNAGPTSK